MWDEVGDHGAGVGGVVDGERGCHGERGRHVDGYWGGDGHGLRPVNNEWAVYKNHLLCYELPGQGGDASRWCIAHCSVEHVGEELQQGPLVQHLFPDIHVGVAGDGEGAEGGGDGQVLPHGGPGVGSLSVDLSGAVAPRGNGGGREVPVLGLELGCRNLLTGHLFFCRRGSATR